MPLHMTCRNNIHRTLGIFHPLTNCSMYIRALMPVLTNNTLIHTHKHRAFNGPLSGTTRVGRYQETHSPTHTYPNHQTSFINYLHQLRSMASSLFHLHAGPLWSTSWSGTLYFILHTFLHPNIITNNKLTHTHTRLTDFCPGLPV